MIRYYIFDVINFQVGLEKNKIRLLHHRIRMHFRHVLVLLKRIYQ